ncbi:hypothetical protein [Pseudodesulfovibrio sp. zrk46]|uniref:hypothetical protein n=1 Tax=Pseudodesulfovibrio sp. zrk46 TaxID=2725288 RepID=UPI001FFD08CD|nr:hypothetical protein [Pseudodesulfovibrio sp. zrk46]
MCKHCGVKFVRKSDKMARRMTTSARIAMASGGLLVVIAVILALNNAYIFAGATFIVGALLGLIGKSMD